MGAGRPKTLTSETISMEQVELCGRFRATYETMAGIFECCKLTVQRYMDDEESEFCYHYKKGMANGKMSLAEAQWNEALKGNSSLLIWLGKQHLGQTDRQEVDQTVTQTTHVINLGDGDEPD